MRQFSIAGAAGLFAFLAMPLQAQDLVSSVNSVTRSYNYVEIQYLPDVDADLPVLAIAVVDLNDNWSLRAEYTNQGNDSINIAGFDGKLDATGYGIGVLYHKPLAAISNSDWVAGLMVGEVDVEFKSDFLPVPGKYSDSFQELYLGIRRTLAPAVEGEVGVSAFRSDDVNDESETTFEGDLKLVVRVQPALDIALSMNDFGNGDDYFGFGLRYTWH